MTTTPLRGRSSTAVIGRRQLWSRRPARRAGDLLPVDGHADLLGTAGLVGPVAVLAARHLGTNCEPPWCGGLTIDQGPLLSQAASLSQMPTGGPTGGAGVDLGRWSASRAQVLATTTTCTSGANGLIGPIRFPAGGFVADYPVSYVVALARLTRRG